MGTFFIKSEIGVIYMGKKKSINDHKTTLQAIDMNKMIDVLLFDEHFHKISYNKMNTF